MKSGWIVAAMCLGALPGMMHAQEPAKVVAATAGTPRIKFDRTVYDFGKTSQVERVSGTFIFQNVGDGVLKLDKPTTSCGCTVAGVKPDVLQPGEKGELSFTLNMPKYRGTLQKQITVTCNDPQNAHTMLTVKAEYVPLFDIKPAYWTMINVHKGDSTNISAIVSRTDGKAFTVTRMAPTQTNLLSWIQTKAEPVPGSTNGAVTITLTIKPESGPRYFADSLNVSVDGAEQTAFSMPFSGRVLGDLTLSRESIYWPITDPARAVLSQPITIRSGLADKLEIKNVTSSLSNVTVESVQKDDKTYELSAKLAAVPDRSTNGVIHFETNIGSQPRIDIPVIIALIKPVPTMVKPRTTGVPAPPAPLPAPAK